LRRLQKTGRDFAAVTCCGRSFQTREAATGKARSPTVDSQVRRTISDGDDAERRQRRPSMSAGRQSSTARYGGAERFANTPQMDYPRNDHHLNYMYTVPRSERSGTVSHSRVISKYFSVVAEKKVVMLAQEPANL